LGYIYYYSENVIAFKMAPVLLICRCITNIKVEVGMATSE